MKSAKKRPPETGEPVLVRMQRAQLRDLDDWRRRREDMPSRAAAIRYLVDWALAIAAERESKKKR